jgi:hypothetical protein
MLVFAAVCRDEFTLMSCAPPIAAPRRAFDAPPAAAASARLPPLMTPFTRLCQMPAAAVCPDVAACF